ncbi:MAG: leucyl aminopeptidase [Candidatus Omnitrophica bacterium]|nr:leucyl aminopeptidase [Candidatus Omnitrophota bacterium]
MIKFHSTAQFDQDATVLIIEKNNIKHKKFSTELPSDLKQEILKILDAGQFCADKCDLFPIIYRSTLVLLIGVGQRTDISSTAFRICLKTALQSKYLQKKRKIEIIPCDTKDETIQVLIEAIMIGTYTWQKYITKSCEIPFTEKSYTIASPKKKLFDDTVAVSRGTNFSRDLVNDNADLIASDYLEKVIKKLVKDEKKITVEVLNKREMKAKGLNLHLAVNQGSQKEPKLIIVKYNGANNKKDYTAIVGKGMTFDTGGLNLKPTGNIESMKLDMSGAAAVIGTLMNTIALNLKKNILFVCGIAENVTGSGSYKPGEVITSYSGKTVEIANTDAEGRLVLADAISYVIKNYKPERIIDIATLTGACIVALGHNHSALVSTDEKLAQQLTDSAKETDDRVWRLPIYPELSESVKSQIADIRNLGYPKGAGGTITAAEFLRQFTEDTKWAHLDIAGTAFVDNAKRLYFGHGATGAGVRLLTHYLQNN